MQPMIKNIVEEKYTEKSYKQIGYDEELPLISFTPEDLSAVINAVFHVAANMCSSEIDRLRILNYASNI
jgi:hypothetical protein